MYEAGSLRRHSLSSFSIAFRRAQLSPLLRKGLAGLLSVSVSLSVIGLEGCKKSEQTQPNQSASNQQQGQAPATTNAMPSADQLYQLVAPIALFPDNLLAQVLAASTFPDEVSAAYTWLQQNSSLKGQQLMQAANEQSWDPSVKGLTQFSDVLSQMATNLSWTSALGDAYFNYPQSVMNAVQVMRQRAQQSGSLKSSQQQKVTVESKPPGQAPAPVPADSTSASSQTVIVQPPAQTIIIQPAQPDVVYVPTYNPTVVYGAPVPAYPGYSTGDMVAASLLSFGVGIAVGAAISGGGGCCGWGWNSWGCGWNNNTVVYNHNTYISNSNTFVNRNNYNANINNINRNNINTNNINRNNVNANNINRNNLNANNANRNNLNNNNRTNNFKNTNYSEPHFNQKYDAPQYQNRNQDQNARQQPGGGQQPNFNQNRGQGQNRAGGQPNFNQNRNQNLAQNTRNDASRGYGQQQADRGNRNSAFNDYSAGGNARTNSARGQQSLQQNRGNAGGGGGGGARAGGGGERGGGGGGRRR
jgi:hypothetical protein